MSIACTRINNEPLSTSLLGDDKEPNVFNSIFHKKDGASLHQVTNETHVVTLAVLEKWIKIPTSLSQPGFHVSNLRSWRKHTLLVRIQVRRS